VSIFSDVAAIKAGQDKIVQDLADLKVLFTTADTQAQTGWTDLEKLAADFVAAQQKTNVLLQTLIDSLNQPPPVTGVAVKENPPTVRPV